MRPEKKPFDVVVKRTKNSRPKNYKVIPEDVENKAREIAETYFKEVTGIDLKSEIENDK